MPFQLIISKNSQNSFFAAADADPRTFVFQRTKFRPFHSIISKNSLPKFFLCCRNKKVVGVTPCILLRHLGSAPFHRSSINCGFVYQKSSFNFLLWICVESNGNCWCWGSRKKSGIVAGGAACASHYRPPRAHRPRNFNSQTLWVI